MSISIQCNDKTFNDIELILLDICGTMFDFENLWLKQVGYLAQNLAENHATFRGELFRIRAMLIKALGVDPEDGHVDYSGAYFSCSDEEIKAILATVLYLNNIDWLKAKNSVENTIAKMLEELDPIEFIKLYPDTSQFLKDFSHNVRIIPYSLKTFVKTDLILMQYNLFENIENSFCTDTINIGKLNKFEIVKYTCSHFDINPENILILADSLGDFPEDCRINKVFVNRNLIQKDYLEKISFDHIINNIGEIKVRL